METVGSLGIRVLPLLPGMRGIPKSTIGHAHATWYLHMHMHAHAEGLGHRGHAFYPGHRPLYIDHPSPAGRALERRAEIC